MEYFLFLSSLWICDITNLFLIEGKEINDIKAKIGPPDSSDLSFFLPLLSFLVMVSILLNSIHNATNFRGLQTFPTLEELTVKSTKRENKVFDFCFSIHWWSFTGAWATPSLLGFPVLFRVFYLSLTMLWTRWSWFFPCF